MADLEDNLNNLEEAELNELLKNGNPEEIRKNLLEMLDNAGLTEEMKENLRNMLTGNTPKVLGKMADEMDAENAPQLNIASAISEKLQESIKNLDVVSLIKKMVDQVPQDEEAEGVQDKLKEIIGKYNSMTDEEKEEFSSKMKEAMASKIALKMQDPNAFDLSGLEEAIGDAVRYQLMLIGGAVILFLILLVFFGYKLYKSIKDKEVKREEKKKAKQMKKKK